jgi:CRP/FNR family transcriptional regulator, cyclic AMP receptor protein
MKGLQFSLRSAPLFEGVGATELADIEQRCAWRRYSAGEEILGYQDETDDVYFIAAGRAKVTIYSARGRAVDFRDLRQGDMFGEYAAIDGGRRTASIEAEHDCVVAAMSARDFQNLIWNSRTVSRTLLLHLTKQLRVLTQRVYEFSTLAVNNRVQAELLRLARESLAKDATTCQSVQITPAPTHAAIAARISTHREAVTRHISDLVRHGVIERKGRSLIVRDISLLEELVRDATGEY